MAHTQPTPAATVVLAREADIEFEVLLLLRNYQLVFNGGHWVFPGGKIDACDFEGAHCLEYQAACRAAVRETREEAGLDIRLEDLIHTAHWTTPEHLPRRYSTWFFVCPVGHEQAVRVDQGEILEHRWITPRLALAEVKQGLFKLPRPTLETLQDLLPYHSVAELLREVTRRKVRVYPAHSEFYRPAEMGYLPDSD